MTDLPYRPSATKAGSSSAERIKLPGFGLPLREMPPRGKRLPHAIADWCGSSGVTVYERNMLNFMSQITDKPNWDDKVFDETIVQKWRQEATTQYENFTDAMFDYVGPL